MRNEPWEIGDDGRDELKWKMISAIVNQYAMGQEDALHVALALVETIRNPTEDMLDRAHLSESISSDTCLEVWRIMIDELVKEIENWLPIGCDED